MNYKSANKSYEKWLSAQTELLKDDLIVKRRKIAISPFAFFRASFFRWVQQWNENISKELANVPVVLSVGDLHIENFGTWRDQEGRLIWGINDFDESYPMPFTNDLLRLCVSTYLAIDANHLAIDKLSASKEILKGYIKGIKSNGKPFVLEEKHKWLRKIALSELKEPEPFWKRLEKLPDLTSTISSKINDVLISTLPENLNNYKIVHRVAGMGSLGHQRYTILATWNGGMIGREVKAIIPSAVVWANKTQPEKLYYEDILLRSVRCPDPFLKLNFNWLCRRISPHCSRIELFTLPKKRDEKKLLNAMGYETANIHLGSKEVINEIMDKIPQLPNKWLHNTSLSFAENVKNDWKESLS